MSFKIVYCKDSSKKRKSYQDGTLLTSNKNGSIYLSLMDDSHQQIWAGPSKMSITKDFDGTIGYYHVIVEEEINSASFYTDKEKENSTLQSPQKFKPFGAPKRIKLVEPQSQTSTPSSSCTTSRISSTPLFAAPSCGRIQKFQSTSLKSERFPTLDPILMKLMKPHQIDGANFLLNCLYRDDRLVPHTHGKWGTSRFSYEKNDDDDDDDDNDGNRDDDAKDDDDFTEKRIRSQPVLTHSGYLSQRIRGCILADDMGLGKSLTALSVLWALIRRRNCKGIIIVPSSLIDNWENEIKKWLCTKLAPLCARSTPPGAEAIINTFKFSHISMSPVMIVSYEMFRKHIDLINTVAHLEIIICDEGHRLKNVDPTKTSDAIKKCMATKRIVLTGTPIQNDLQELFAIVDFVAPGFLGTLHEFRQQFEIPISRAREPTSTAYHIGIGKTVSTKLQEMLSLIMIRRCQSDILVSQLPEKHECVILSYLNKQQCQIYREHVTKLFDSINRVPPFRCYIEAESSRKARDVDEDDECRENTRIMDTTNVLSTLLRLRKACSYIDLGEPLDSQDNFFACSAKIAIIDLFLSTLKIKFPDEKVVIVSNFTSTLDIVQKLLDYHAWTYLRLDGSVPVGQRQHLVDRFNMPFQTNSNGETFGSFVFLLSSLAGGVGINLIGASRLILMDPSWNPATDKQAMARIWREGQKRPVFIYRMISPGTIESAMFRRQQKKLELEDVLAHNSNPVDMEDLTTDAPFFEDLKIFTVRSLGELVYSEEFGGVVEEMGCDRFDVVLDNVLSLLGSNCIRFSSK